MSAPQTNLEKQRKRHLGPLLGIAFGLSLAVLLAVSAFMVPGVPRDQQAAPPVAQTASGES